MSLADLEKKYPLIFAQAKPRGGPGWLPMLDVLCSQIQARAGESGVQPVALQAREKWGILSLRFFRLDTADASLVAYVEELSKRVCEVCGGPAQLVQGTHLRTRCEAHRDIRKRAAKSG